MKLTPTSITTLSLTAFTLFFGVVLSSLFVSADDVVDQVNITVPVSCTMSGTGINSHNAEINNGTYNSAIGETTIKAFCNDNEGFAIYATGYTNSEEGNNVLTNSNLGSSHDIITGTATSGNDSQWAMKLSTISSPAPAYPIIIAGTSADTLKEQGDPDFSTFQEVPDDYTKVAYRTSNTDIGTNAEGSTLTTTYQAYISPTQSAGTYTGQVKYTLVHPHNVDKNAMKDAVTVAFDGNGLTFPNGDTTNIVKYAKVRDQGSYAYVSNTVGGISKTSNVNNDGTQNGSIVTNDDYSDSVTIEGADRLKVVLRYDVDPSGIDTSNANAYVNVSDSYSLYSDYYGNGTETIMAEGDTVYFYYASWGDINESHDYGYYAEVYAAYDDERLGTTGETLPSNSFTFLPISGTYMETTEWHDKWITTIDDYDWEFQEDLRCDADWCAIDNSARGSLMNYLKNNYDSLKGTTLNVRSYNPVTFDEVYVAANKTKVNGYYKMQDLDASMCADVSRDEVATVIDIRDNKTYSISKLNNGWCWMRNDLELDPTDSTTAANLSASNTNASEDAIYNYLHGGNPNNNDGWSSVAVIEDNTNGSFTEPKIDKSIHYDVAGISYNYCAISVGTYCHDNNNSWVSHNAVYDLCPKNWHLPSSTSEISGSLVILSVNSSERYWSSLRNTQSAMGVYAQDNYYWYGVSSLRYLRDPNNVRSRYYRARCIISDTN